MLGRLKRLIGDLARPKVVFNDLERSRPVSNLFGFDRGQPIDRYYIEKFLDENSNYIKGSVLEIADSHYSKKFGGDKVDRFEILHYTNDNPEATIIGDLTNKSTLPENRIDCFICTQTFNFIFNVQRAVEGASHLLKPGGVLLATLGGISQISRYDMDRWGDFWRFTTASAEQLFTPYFSNVTVQSYGNVLSSVAFLQGLAVEDLPDKSLLNEKDHDYQMVVTVIARK